MMDEMMDTNTTMTMTMTDKLTDTMMDEMMDTNTTMTMTMTDKLTDTMMDEMMDTHGITCCAPSTVHLLGREQIQGSAYGTPSLQRHRIRPPDLIRTGPLAGNPKRPVTDRTRALLFQK